VHGFAIAAGYVGAALSVGMVVPQLIRTLRHPGLGGVSAISWLFTAAGCSAWLLYGIKGQIWPQIPGNALIIPGAAAIVLAAPARLTVFRRALLLAATAGALIVTAVLARPDDLGYLAFALSLVSALPQTITSVSRRRDGRSAVSIPAWAMRGASSGSWLFYAVLMHERPVVVSSLVTLASVAVVITAECARLIGARLGRRLEDPALGG
jgi:uncharacterized protein with PQ loop repeat